MWPPTVVLATGNPDKVAEWRLLAPEVGWTVVPGLPSPDETGSTVVENAVIKARAAFLATGLPALGDDVGLWVEAWSGAPGLDLKPWAESLGGWVAARAALAEVAGSPATYRCGVALCGPTGLLTAEGVAHGHVAPADGDGPGVEPCFVPGGQQRSLASLAPDLRRSLHHRVRALQALQDSLRAALRTGPAGRP
jgi:XTP/dITP diphosphohydrolase